DTPFVDVIYIPKKVNEGKGISKQKYLLLTQEAVDAVKKDNILCSNAVKISNKNKKITALSKLGIMDPFNSIAHETFLRLDDPKLAEKYKELLFVKVDLEKVIIKKEDLNLDKTFDGYNKYNDYI
ncbi:hypothetical protein, partial [Vibrio eleionomae]|uniref:hypothetical protein n=1 Tax=Vibrio eleionomae TaxID=2653505 RepID=UPI00137160E1